MKSRGARPGILFIAAAMLASATFTTHATPPSSQTQQWHIIAPDCTVTHSWRQDGVPNAKAISGSGTVVCADAATEIFLPQLQLFDYTAGETVSYQHDNKVFGSVAYSFTNVRPSRGHVYDLAFSFVLIGPVGSVSIGPPPQCTTDTSLPRWLNCSFVQSFVGVTNRPVTKAPASPTPFSFYRAAQGTKKLCTWKAKAVRVAGAAIKLTVNQNCPGYGRLDVYIDRQETAPIASIDYGAGGTAGIFGILCEVGSIFDQGGPGGGDCVFGASPPYKATVTLPARDGQTFTLEWRSTTLKVAGPVPSECSFYSSVAQCRFTMNVVAAG